MKSKWDEELMSERKWSNEEFIKEMKGSGMECLLIERWSLLDGMRTVEEID